jgi:hypothetical protein
MKYELRATGKRIRFTEVMIGNPFAAHGKMWVRTSYEAASELAYSGYRAGSVCNFMTDPEDEWVEFVNVIIDGNEAPEQHGPSLRPELLDSLEPV